MKAKENLRPPEMAERVLGLLGDKGKLELQEILKSLGADREELLKVIKFLLSVGYVELRLSPSGRKHLQLPKP